MSHDTVLAQFQQQLAQCPDRPAVVDGRQRLSYRELDARSRRVAARLQQYGVGPGSLVPVLAHRSANLVVALLAVLYAGAAYVPVDRQYPDKRRRHILGQCDAALLLSTADDQADAVDGLPLLTVDALAAEADAAALRPPPVDAHAPVYVIFTSGTTGVPKGVVIEHHSLARLVAWHNARFFMVPDSRTTLMAGVGFDVAQWEIWSTLAAGACLYLPDDATRFDPAALLAFYAEHAISHAYAPTVLVPELVGAAAPADLALRYLFTAGEKLHPLATHHLGYTLVDYYGPTEATIFATCRVVAPHSEHQPASIGVTVADTEAFILDEHGREAPPGEPGELHLAGRCLARGYLGQPALTAERFVQPAGFGQRLYRTGDLARWLPDGTLQFLGRRDDQIKLRGYRIELGDIEAALLRQPLLKAAVVLVDEGAGPADRRLAAFVVARQPAIADAVLIAALRDGLREELPDYMLPARYHCLAALPATANGKTDKAALRALLAAEHAAAPQPAFDDATEQTIAAAWRGTLGHGHFGATDSFFEVGGHSLLAAALVKDIGQRLGIKTYIRDLYEHPTIHRLAVELQQRQHRHQATLDSEPIRALQDDIRLPPGVDFSAGFDPQQLTRPRHILLTGATGFVGVHLLAELLATTGARLHCPVRGISTTQAAERLRQVAARYQLELSDADWQRVAVYPADLAEPQLGLSAADYATLAEQVDLIYHSASAVNFIQPYSYMKRDNVQGLQQIIAFAAQRRVKPLVLLSTISVYSWGHLHTHKRVMHEDDDIDQNLPAVVTDLGYVRSKWVMEKIADLAAAQGLPLITCRLGYATCHSRTGLCADYQWWGRLIKTCVALGAIPALRDLREGLTTVDYVVEAIAAISRRPSALGHKFNLIPSPERNLTLQAFFDRVAAHLGQPFAVQPFNDWVAQWETDRHAPLYPLLSLFRDNMHDGLSTVELYQDTYLWDCRNVQHFLADAGIKEPEFEGALLDRYLARLLAEPYRPARP